MSLALLEYATHNVSWSLPQQLHLQPAKQNKSGSSRQQPPFCPFPSSWHPPNLAFLLEGALGLREVGEGA